MKHISLTPFSDTKPPTHTHTQKNPHPLSTATHFNIKYRNITSPHSLPAKELPHVSAQKSHNWKALRIHLRTVKLFFVSTAHFFNKIQNAWDQSLKILSLYIVQIIIIIHPYICGYTHMYISTKRKQMEWLMSPKDLSQ